MLGRLAVLAATLVAALVAASLAPADGDPASDTLLQQDVFLPFPAPSSGASAELKTAVQSAYDKGYRLKVAVIATPTDLGAIPSLFGKPTDYAHFLGSELQFFYVGPLLIVMPAGFGIYDGGRPTTAEDQVLGGLKVGGSSPDDLTRAAASAADALVGAKALVSKDITPPYVETLPATAKRGGTLKLQYYLGDDSKRVSATIQLVSGKKVVSSLTIPVRTVQLGRIYATKLLVPKSVSWAVQSCITAVDSSGNRSQKACSPVKIR